MAYDLAKNRINLLDIKYLDDYTCAVNFEYQYTNKDKSKLWQKDILVFKEEEILNLHTTLADHVIAYVKDARSELEK